MFKIYSKNKGYDGSTDYFDRNIIKPKFTFDIASNIVICNFSNHGNDESVIKIKLDFSEYTLSLKLRNDEHDIEFLSIVTNELSIEILSKNEVYMLKINGNEYTFTVEDIIFAENGERYMNVKRFLNALALKFYSGLHGFSHNHLSKIVTTTF